MAEPVAAPAAPAATETLTAADAAALTRPYLATLVRLVRAHDTFGAWDGRSDAVVLADFIVSREQRRTMPIIADPDAKTLWRLGLFYNAAALAIEQETGIVAGPMLDLSHEGYGRAVVLAGRLVAVSRQLRDVHRFGFESLAALAAAGEAIVAEASDTIGRYPDAARA